MVKLPPGTSAISTPSGQGMRVGSGATVGGACVGGAVGGADVAGADVGFAGWVGTSAGFATAGFVAGGGEVGVTAGFAAGDVAVAWATTGAVAVAAGVGCPSVPVEEPSPRADNTPGTNMAPPPIRRTTSSRPSAQPMPPDP